MAQIIHPSRIQILAIIGSILFLVAIVELVRKRKIKEEYGILWIFFAVAFLVISLWRQGLEVLSRLLGIFYAPAAFLLILIQFSLVISRLSENCKTLNQQIGILRLELKELQEKKRDSIAYAERGGGSLSGHAAPH